MFLGNLIPTSYAPGVSAVKTKNPPYDKDAMDSWGMYKSDYIPIDKNENLSRITTNLSNQNVDAWSLRTIQTSIGANIKMNYEGNNYQRSVLTRSKSAIVDVVKNYQSLNQIAVNIPTTTTTDLNSIYGVGENIDAIFLYRRDIQVIDHYASGDASTIFTNDQKVMSLSAYHPKQIQAIRG